MKRTHYTNADGLGLIAIIAIIAVLAIGGAVAYEVSTNNRAEVAVTDTNTDTDANARGDTNAKVGADINALKVRTVALVNDVRAKIDLDGKVDATTDVFAGVKTDITTLYANADAEARASLDDLRADIADAEEAMQAKSDTTAETVSDSLAEIAAHIEASFTEDDMDDTKEDDMRSSSTDAMDDDMNDDTNASVKTNVNGEVEVN